MNDYKTKYASNYLFIDTDALSHNWTWLNNSFNGTAGAVIKASSYGLYIKNTMPTLLKSGCRIFFVASIVEALEAIQIVVSLRYEDVKIYVLNGILSEQELDIFYENNLIPILNTLSQISSWNEYCQNKNEKLPCGIHFDTGIGRYGVSPNEVKELYQDRSLLDDLNIDIVMSHLSFASNNKKNDEQKAYFDEIIEKLNFHNITKSLSATDGYFADDKYRYDVVRFGIGLYGFNGVDNHDHDLKVVARLVSKVIAIKNLPQGYTVGYNDTYTTPKDEYLATIAMGYADGMMREIYDKPQKIAPFALIHNKPYKITGRISMDYIVLNVDQHHDPEKLLNEWACIGDQNSLLSNWVNNERQLYCTISTRVPRINIGNFNPDKEKLSYKNIKEALISIAK